MARAVDFAQRNAVRRNFGDYCGSDPGKMLKTFNVTAVNVVTGRSKNFERGGAEDNLSAPSSLIANVHNEIYDFYTEKAAF